MATINLLPPSPNPPPLKPQKDTKLLLCLLSPVIFIAVLILGLVNLVSLRLSLAPYLPWAALFGILALLWWFSYFRLYLSWALLAAVASWAVLAMVANQIWPWPTISSHPDAWSYWTVAHYLSHHVRGASEGMSIVDQFASHLMNTRFASSCLLALASLLTGGSNPFVAHTLYYVACITVLVFSTGYLCHVLGLSQKQSLLTAGITSIYGWLTDSIIIGNYDNILLFILFPAGLGLLLQFLSGNLKRSLFIPSGAILGAAIICAYPEGAALTGVLLIPLILYIFFRHRNNLRIIRDLFLTFLIGLLLAAPYLPILFSFFKSQLIIANIAGPRPGIGNFTNLLSRSFLPAFFSLGNEFPHASTALSSNILPIIALIFIAIGAWRLSRRWPWFSWTAIPFMALLTWQAIASHYDYGTYKVIDCFGWWLYPAMVVGGTWAIERFSRAPWIVCALTFGLLAGAAFQRLTQWHFRIWPPNRDLSALAELPSISFVTHGKPVLLNVEPAFDQLWSVSLLSHMPLIVDHRMSYLAMRHVQPYLSRARGIPTSSEAYVLSTGRHPQSLWENNCFSLFLNRTAIITSVENPNGLETVAGAPFIWIASTQPTVFLVREFQPGHYELTAEDYWFGPSAPNDTQRVLEVTDAKGLHSITITQSKQPIALTLHVGLNRILIRSLTRPTLYNLPNGDTRELLLGLKGYFIESAHSQP